MGMGFAPTWLCQVSPPPLLHKTTLTTENLVALCHTVWAYVEAPKIGGAMDMDRI